MTDQTENQGNEQLSTDDQDLHAGELSSTSEFQASGVELVTQPGTASGPEVNQSETAPLAVLEEKTAEIQAAHGDDSSEADTASLSTGLTDTAAPVIIGNSGTRTVAEDPVDYPEPVTAVVEPSLIMREILSIRNHIAVLEESVGRHVAAGLNEIERLIGLRD